MDRLLAFGPATKLLLELFTGASADAGKLRVVVVDHSATDFQAVDVEQANGVATMEDAAKAEDSPRQQALARADNRMLRPAVDNQLALRFGEEREEALLGMHPRRPRRDKERADVIACEDPLKIREIKAFRNPQRLARARHHRGGLELRQHPADGEAHRVL